MNERELFYLKGVKKFIKDKNSSILICGGGLLDKNIFEKLEFRDVTISNLDERMNGDEYAPYKWKYENAEFLSFKDGSFDYVVIHAAIHHASSPHKVITEMYRVARKGILAFEARDAATMRFLEKSGLTQTFEHAAVYYSECQYGGVNNSEIPNYIYRWTEREVEKTIQSYAPEFKHKFYYSYGTAFPFTPALENKGSMKFLLLKIISPFYAAFVKVFPKQQNLFSFYIEKPVVPDSLYPWLLYDETEGKIIFNKAWGKEKYKPR